MATPHGALRRVPGSKEDTWKSNPCRQFGLSRIVCGVTADFFKPDTDLADELGEKESGICSGLYETSACALGEFGTRKDSKPVGIVQELLEISHEPVGRPGTKFHWDGIRSDLSGDVYYVGLRTFVYIHISPVAYALFYSHVNIAAGHMVSHSRFIPRQKRSAFVSPSR